MKFGKNIGGQQSENSDFHYIEYKLLKKKIKDVVECQENNNMADALSANTSFEQELSSEINQVNTCFERRQKDLLVRIASLSEELQVRGKSGSIGSLPWPPSQESTEPVVVGRSADAAAGVSLQWPEAFAQLCDMLKEVDRLRKYAVWNALGVVKILKKRRKQTSFGLEDVCSERAGWLSRQSFFSGSEFAELHAAVESIGHALVLSELAPGSQPFACSNLEKQQLERQPQQCPICLDLITDMVELDCKHRFCWKCFVLGPIAFQPGEYRITSCPICRRETSQVPVEPGVAESCETPFTLGAKSVDVTGSEGMLTRFLHTYYPQGAQSLIDADTASNDDASSALEMDVVGDLVKVVLADQSWQKPLSKATGSSVCGPVSPEKQQMHAAQKLQWLQLASENDPFAIDSTMYCSLCSEPLLMEAVLTTPCKHHFHRICVKRLEMPQCPLCSMDLPFSWFLCNDHPLVDRGFRVVPMYKYKPLFPGGPDRACGGFPLHQPPPKELHGSDGLTMMSYLHRMPPMGHSEDDVDIELFGSKNSPTSPTSATTGGPDGELSSVSESSSEDSASEDDREAVDNTHRSYRRSRSNKRAHTAIGRMRICH
mmetsp:Transcript_136537/g.251100  ORF Transcript_136537/g.251100 Transcript_136537/m.251100 type:complete len:600 (+) Transcript_136537:72-1871(+)